VIQGLAVESGNHVVHLYEREADLIETVGEYLLTGLRQGSSALVIATERHRRAFESELESHGLNVAEALAGKTLVVLDAAQTLSAIMVDGRIDGDAFRRVVGRLVNTASSRQNGVCAYGEMVSLLWETGDVLNVVDLETLWNDLLEELPFSLMCAYRAESLSRPEEPGTRDTVCRLHSAVLRGSDRVGKMKDAGDGSQVSDVPAVSKTPEVIEWFESAIQTPASARRLVTEFSDHGIAKLS